MAKLNKRYNSLVYFLTTVEHTENILRPNKGLIPSLLKVFAMFQLCLFYYTKYEEENVVEAISIKCSNCNKDTGLHI